MARSDGTSGTTALGQNSSPPRRGGASTPAAQTCSKSRSSAARNPAAVSSLVFEFWRACRYKLCRKAKACSGDACDRLNRGIDQVPYDVQNRARDRIIAATSSEVYCAVKTARRFSLRDLC